jgi:crossover junction endodeoxyribonuclease RusA
MIQLNLPMPPSTNRYYRNFNGRMIISLEGRQYTQRVRLEIYKQRSKLNELTGRLRVEAILNEPDKRRRDLDNWCGKALLDALQKGGVYRDDAQIDILIIRRGVIQKPGNVVVEITEL